MTETIDAPSDIAELSVLVLQDIQFELWDMPLEEQTAALQRSDYSRITANVIDSRFRVDSRVAHARDPDIYVEKVFNPHPSLKFTGYASSVIFRQPFDEYGGLMVSFVEPEARNVSEERAEILKHTGILVPVLAMVSCDKIGHIHSS